MKWKINFSENGVRQPKHRRKIKTRPPYLWLVFAVLLLLCAAGMGTAAADTVNAGTFQQLSDAINGATGVNSTRTIVITGEILVGTTSFPAIGVGKNITLKPNANANYDIFRTDGNSSSSTGLFTINGGNLTITANNGRTLTLHGNGIAANTQPLVYVTGYSSTFTLANGTITGNTADYGGGVYVKDGTFTMSGGEITDNFAKKGGGVYVEYDGDFTMSGGEITGNFADYGGGVYVEYDGDFTMSGGEITGNDAVYGGGVYNYGMFMMFGGTITGNTADYGGGVCVEYDGDFTMSGGTITNNTADEGGGVYVEYHGDFTMSGGEITGNDAEYGGGVYNCCDTLDMDGGTITNNNAEYGGGVYVYNNYLDMYGGTITNNTAEHGGGGIYLTDNSDLHMDGVEITNNTAEYFGGGIYLSYNSDLHMDGVEITNNTAEYGGGGIYLSYNSDLHMDGVEITNNTAEYGGGGIYLANNSYLDMDGGTITNNTAEYGGGIYLIDNSHLDMYDGTITSNYAKENGGGVYLAGTFMMTGGSTITSNNAGYEGGGVYVGYDGDFTMDDGEIIHNTAAYGGGVAVRSGTITIAGGDITDNIANYYGSGVYVINGDFTISGSASVDATNEVYLHSSRFINVILPLTGGAHNITHEDTAAGTKIVELPAGTGDVYRHNFILSPQMSPLVLKYNDTGTVPIYELAESSLVPITAVTAAVTAPVGGASPSYTATGGDDSQYTATVYNWYRSSATDANIMTDSDIFASGKTYIVEVEFMVCPGYRLLNSTQATINGNTTILMVGNTYETARYRTILIAADPIEITGAAATLDALPFGGETPDYGATPGDDSQYTAVVTQWRGPGGIMTGSDIFTAGDIYEARVLLTPKAGYTFTASSTAVINGQSAALYDRTDEGHTYSVSFTAPGLNETDPPTVASVTPDGTGATRSGFMFITFSEPMDTGVEGTVEINGVAVHPDFGGFYPYDSNTVYRIQYGMPFDNPIFGEPLYAYDETCSVKITGFKDRASTPNAMTPYEFSFTIQSAPPVLSDFSVTRTSETTATLHFTTDKPGTAYYYMAVASLDNPSATWIVANGQSLGGVSGTVSRPVTMPDEWGRHIIIVVQDEDGSNSNTLKATMGEYEPDNVPPTVVSVTPDGSGAPVSGDITITFSEPMDTGTEGTVLLDGELLSGGAWTMGDDTVYTVAYSGLANGTSHVVSIAGFKDVTGNEMYAAGGSFATVAAPGTTPTIPPTAVPSTPTTASGGGSSSSIQDSSRVLFETNGGSAALPVTGLSYGDRVTMPANPVKDGYTFGGWYKDAACTVPWTFAEDAVPGDITLYAKWISGATPTTTVTATATMTAAATAGTAVTTWTPAVTATTTTTSVESPAETEAPAPVFGVLAGLAAAGVLMRRLTK